MIANSNNNDILTDKINVLLIGSGAREHSIAICLNRSQSIGQLFAYPGNPGIFECSEKADIDLKNDDTIVDFCNVKNIKLVIIGPEQPLADGLTDVLKNNGINVFGPTKYAAQLESSKDFAKQFMSRYNIPTAKYKSFDKYQQNDTEEYIDSNDKMPIVIKADGLAAGKGVVIANTKQEAKKAVNEMFAGAFKDAGNKIVIEEFMPGEEASVFAMCDGQDYVCLAPAQDHKRAFDNDEGPNTGGMGAYAPAPIVNSDVLSKVKVKIIEPVLKAMKAEGHPFVGCLYCGLMIKDNEPRVVEFNVRLGDPETEAVLSIFEGDFCKLLYTASIGKIDKTAMLSTVNKSACTIILASKGYPLAFDKGFEISGIDKAKHEFKNDLIIYHAGTKLSDDKLYSNGGRVIAVNAIADTLADAIKTAYKAADFIDFENKFYRHDIGRKALK